MTDQMNTHSKLKATRAAKSNVNVNVLCECKLDDMINREMVVLGNIQKPVFKIVYYRMDIVSAQVKGKLVLETFIRGTFKNDQ